MKIFTTGDISCTRFEREAQRVLDDVGRYLQEHDLLVSDVKIIQKCYDSYRTIFSAIVLH